MHLGKFVAVNRLCAGSVRGKTKVNRSHNSVRSCLRPEADLCEIRAKVEVVRTLGPADCVAQLPYRSIAPARSAAYVVVGDASSTDIEGIATRCRIIRSGDLGEERNCASRQTQTNLIHQVRREGRAKRRHIRETVGYLASIVREARESRIDVVEKINFRIEVVEVVYVLEVMLAREVEVEAYRRELSNLPASVDERETLEVWIREVLD